MLGRVDPLDVMLLGGAWFLLLGVLMWATRKRAAARHYEAVSKGGLVGRLFPVTEQQAIQNARVVAVITLTLGCLLVLNELINLLR